MIDLSKGSNAATQATADPWNMNGVDLRSVNAPVPNANAALNKQMGQMAMSPQQQAQFSPVQFAGPGQGGALSAYIAQLLKGTGQ